MDMEQFKSLMECSICLDKFKDPKMLRCGHLYCKDCLDDIIVFNNDGSAILTCPLKCAIKTVVGSDETVNDFPTPYNFIGILEGCSETDDEEPQNPPCRYVESCGRKVSFYCCEMLLCERCSVNHRKIDAKHMKKKLFFSKKNNKLKVVCEKHGSQCNDLCCDGTFLCKYCLNRDESHETHAKNPIDREVELLKEALLNDLKIKENIYQFKKATEKSILLSTNKINKLLQVRREECLAYYNDFLKQEEEMLKRKFKSICDDHMDQYAQIRFDYDQHTLTKKDIELAIQKRKILEAINNNESKTFLNCETVSLSETFHFQDDHPLGDIKVNNEVDISVDSSPVSTMKDNIILPRINDVDTQDGTSGSSIANCGDSEKTLSQERPDGQGSSLGAAKVSSPTHHSQRQTVDASLSAAEIVNNPSNKTTKAYFDITIDGVPSGRIIFDLYGTVVPRTTANFVQLCTHEKGFGYKGTKLFSIVKGVCCKGGDVINNDGSAGKSVYGPNFQCENFEINHDKRGILAMAKHGGSNDSRFIIYIKAAPLRDGHNVAFGKVTYETYPIIKKIASIKTTFMKVKENGYMVPHENIVIVNCGVL